MTLRLGTRRSQLATTQSGHVADALRALGHHVELVEIVTEGDRNLAPLDQIGGTGVFAAAVREALTSGAVDLAVHSRKDLPTAPAPGLMIAATPPRADVRDALIARDGLTLGELPPGSRIGTGSPRRVAQLAALGLGHECVAIRGNVETRISQVTSGALDAVVLAKAGLDRLGLTHVITEILDPIQMLPAAGQGALAVECRIDDAATRAILAHIDDPDTRTAVTAERAVLARLEAGCTAPIGVLAEIVDDVDALAVFVRAFVGSADDSVELRRSHTGPAANAKEVGRRFADLLLAELPPGTTGEPPDPGGEHAAYAPRPDLPENDRPQTDRPEKETAQ